MTRSDWLICILAAGCCLGAALWYISLPGLQYDECLAAAPAVNFVLGANNSEPMQINPSVIHIFGRPLPVMVMTYIGPVKTLLHIPVFAIFGISPTTVRILPIMVVLLCFPLTYALCLYLLNLKIARTTVALMAFDPSFVFYLTRDVGPAALQVFFKLLALVMFWRWWKEEKLSWLLGGMFVLGIGVSHKVDFLWVIGGVVVGIFGLNGRELWKRLSRRAILFGLLSFSAGALPIIAFNLASGGYAFTPFLLKLFSSSGSDGGTFWQSVWQRTLQTIQLLNGDYISTLFTGRAVETHPLTYVFPLMMLVSLLSLPFVVWKKEIISYSSSVVGLWIFIVTVFVASCFSPTTLSGHHLLALYPMLHVAIACALVSLSSILPFIQRYHIEKAVVTFLLVVNLAAVVSINKSLTETGGAGVWSDAIYELNAYLGHRGQPVAAMEWGFTNNLIVLSRGQLHIRRVYRDFWEKGTSSQVVEPYLHRSFLYLFHSPEFPTFQPAYEALKEAAARQSYVMREEKSFFQRDGQRVFTLYSLNDMD